MIVRKASYRRPPEGAYQVRIDKIDEMDTQFGLRLRFTFTVMNGKYQGKTFAVIMSPNLSERSRLGELARAIFGYVPDLLDTQQDLKRKELIFESKYITTKEGFRRWTYDLKPFEKSAGKKEEADDEWEQPF